MLQPPQPDKKLKSQPGKVRSQPLRPDKKLERPPGKERGRQLLAGIVRGAAMGCADVVPGVSGGTIAVVLGIYERLLNAMRNLSGAAWTLLRGDRRGALRRLREVDWWLVVPLLTGILGTILLLASVIETQLEERPETMAGLFCGLVAASAVAARRLFRWRSFGRIVLMAGTAGVTFALLGLRAGQVVDPPLPVLFATGAVAVCAMILPGVSGAFLLVMLGMYSAVITILNEMRLLEAMIFAGGAATGLMVFSSLLGWLLHRARDVVMAVLVGLMFGSLRVLWPWPDGVGIISRHGDESTPITDVMTNGIVTGTGLAWPAADQWLTPTMAAAAGFVAVLAVTRMARHYSMD